ncbi:MAG: peptidase U37 [Deltaproteobacteria bacterium CG_4_10_14_0_2_um_filter_43_8]|nr:MAG: peptidase U37 [Deltaproteobacteria bacterium CG11_big_fil_rev_8_21_14_0_20_42_23]PJA20531.1 MAG: peptidase U37 [Deltaproteobacteria bacterium CG_4_10_14_0_2_um_filter_43_8]PJC65036.1 MAG: peptidase U37 [Deltaproteobacteria bacterium CG_4_9_14_0_2_um_filter_42_21]
MKKKNIQSLNLRAQVQPSSVDEEKRTMEVVFTTKSRVRREPFFDEPFMEELSMNPSHVRLERLNNGAPLLNSHKSFSLGDVIGVVESASVDGKKGTATVRFSDREEVQPIFNDVKNGIIRNVSVGYRVYKFKELKELDAEEGIKVLRAVDWEPFEISAVPIPADNEAKFRKLEKNECQFLLANEEERNMNKLKPKKREDTLEEEKTKESQEEEKEETQGEEVAESSESKDDANSESSDESNDDDSDERSLTAKDAIDIFNAVRSANLPYEFAENLINKNTSMNDARKLIVKELSAQQRKAHTNNVRAEVSDMDYKHYRKVGIESALLHRAMPEKHELKDEGREWVHMSLVEIARKCLEQDGVRTAGMSHSEIAECALGSSRKAYRDGFHTTDDFPLILENIATKTLRNGYESAPQTFAPFTRRIALQDFKQVSRVQLGDAPRLEEVLDDGEVKRGTIGEGAEKYAAKTYSKIVSITRKVIVNDDLDAFTRIPFLFGRATGDLESDLVWAEITNNANMADNQPLFSVVHANLAGIGEVGAPNVGTLGIARAAMRVQTGLNGAPINVEGRWVFGPAALETEIQQLVSGVLAAQMGATDQTAVNPFFGRLQFAAEPRLDAVSLTAWYLTADVSQLDIVELGTLDGQRGPRITTRTGFDTDGVEIRATYDGAAKVIDHRGLYLNAG